MNVKNFLTTLIRSGKPSVPAQRDTVRLLQYLLRYLLFIILIGCSLCYKGVVQLRMYFYQTGIFIQASLPCPVISIGNITTGGTGKTPAVIEIARLLREHGTRVVILSRGYRREASTPSYVVQPDADVRIAGDEPLLMARKLQSQETSDRLDIPVIVGSQRYLSGKLALERFHPDVLLLDDGFQHIQLERTFDLVLIDATNPFGGGYMLPAGFLREPIQHLARAHTFIITRSDEVADITPIEQQLRRSNPDAPIFRGIHACDEIKKAPSAEVGQAVSLNNLRLLAVSGLGNPASFHRLLDLAGLNIVKHLDFPDHYRYTEQDAYNIQRIAVEHRIDAIIVTEKDEAKLSPHSDILGVSCYVMTITLEIHPKEKFENLLLNIIS